MRRELLNLIRRKLCFCLYLIFLFKCSFIDGVINYLFSEKDAFLATWSQIYPQDSCTNMLNATVKLTSHNFFINKCSKET